MSYRTSTMCASCTSQPSITSCEGCQRKFCLPCLSTHRNELSQELDELINRRNELFEIINNQVANNTASLFPCFDKINQWKTDMHANIDRVAIAAQDNVRQLLSDASKNVRIELDKVSQDLQQRQKTGGYVESDLNRAKQQLTHLNDTVKRFNDRIRIDTSVSDTFDWDSLLFVMPTEESRPHIAAATAAPPNANLYSSFQRRTSDTTSMHQQQFYPTTSMPQQQFQPSTSTHQQQFYPTTSIPHQQFNPSASMPHQQFYPSTSILRSNDTHRPAGRSASISTDSRPRTFQCIGCKTVNTLNDSGYNVCSTCRCPARF